MPIHRILCIDDDPDVHVFLQRTLRKNGFEVISATDAEWGIAQAVARQPDLIILDVTMPMVDGWAVIRKLRSTTHTSIIPILFHTKRDKAEDRMQGFRLGADDYIPKSVSPEELLVRIRAALQRRIDMERVLREHIHPAAPSEKSGLRGSLDHIGLSPLLSLIEMEGRSGILTISQPAPGTVGKIYFTEGRIVQARMYGREAAGAEGVYEMLHWSRGHFEFQPSEHNLPDQVDMTTTSLLMEGARRIDESQRGWGGP